MRQFVVLMELLMINDCYAENAGITKWTEGECEWKKLKLGSAIR